MTTKQRFSARSEGGFSLLELMVAALLFLVISSSVYVLFSRSQKAFVSQEDLVAAQQNARASMDYVTEAITQAGYGVATPQVYATIVQADPTSNLPTSDGNTSAFADFGSFDATNTPMDATHIFLKGCFSKTFGALTNPFLIPSGSLAFPPTSLTLSVSPLNGSFAVGDNVMLYDVNPGSMFFPFTWIYGTVSSVSTPAGTPPLISLGVSMTDGTIPGTGPFGGYTVTQGTMIYKVETRAFRLNGNVLEVSDNDTPYETLIDHVSALAFRYYDSTGTEITLPINTLAGRASIQKVLVQITAQSVKTDMQSNQPLSVTYSSDATPRNFIF